MISRTINIRLCHQANPDIIVGKIELLKSGALQVQPELIMLITGLQVHQSVETEHQVLILQVDPPFEHLVTECAIDMQSAIHIAVQE